MYFVARKQDEIAQQKMNDKILKIFAKNLPENVRLTY